MLGNYQENEQFREGNVSDREIDLESEGQQRDANPVERNFRSLLNTNLSENSEITAETSRAINSEISSQMSRKLEGMKSDLNSHILEVINSAIEGKVIPRIISVLGDQNAARNVNLDLRSDGPHPSTSSSSRPQWDLGSNGRHQENVNETVQNTKKDFPRLVAMTNNHPNHHRGNHEDPNQSDGDDDYDNCQTKL